VWCCYSGPLVSLTIRDLTDILGVTSYVPQVILKYLVFNAAFFLYLAYGLYYLVLDTFAGLLSNIELFSLLLFANYLHQTRPEQAGYIALGVHILSWYMQIHPGHAVFEKRKPALKDSFIQSLVSAPLFVVFEVLFPLGYKPELRRAVQKRVSANITAYRKSEKASKSS
jgi:2-hydroxy fatty acid dioxygenase